MGLPPPTMAIMAMAATTESDLLRLSLLLLPPLTMAITAMAATTESDLLRLSPLLSTTSQYMDTTGTTASALLMLSLLPNTTMPTPPMDITLVKDYSKP